MCTVWLVARAGNRHTASCSALVRCAPALLRCSACRAPPLYCGDPSGRRTEIRARAVSRAPRPPSPTACAVCRRCTVAVRAVAGGARCVSSLSFAVTSIYIILIRRPRSRGPRGHEGKSLYIRDQRSAKAFSESAVKKVKTRPRRAHATRTKLRLSLSQRLQRPLPFAGARAHASLVLDPRAATRPAEHHRTGQDITRSG